MRGAVLFIAFSALASLVASAPATMCATRQYLDPTTNTCKACPASMTACSSATVAITCQRGRYITPAKQCVSPTACPPNTFPDASTKSCKKCYAANAATCMDGGTASATSCLSGSCLSGGRCVYIARMGSYQYCSNGLVTSCGTGVLKCDSSGVTITCKLGYNLASGAKTCINPSSQIWNAQTEECDERCTLVATVKTDSSGAFESVKQRAQRFDASLNLCVDCDDPFAESCSSGGETESCISPFENRDGLCVAPCKGDETWNASSWQCELVCSDGHYETDPVDGSTYIVRARWPNYATSTCEYCWDLGAVTCENEPDSHMSINCIEDYFLSNDGQCLTCSGDSKYNSATSSCDSPTCRTEATLRYDNVGNTFLDQRAEHIDVFSMTCKPCNDEFAQNCNDDGSSSSCLAELGAGLSPSGICIRCNNAEGRYYDEEQKSCVLTCPGAQIDFVNSIILTPATYKDVANDVCVPCLDPLARFCASDGRARVCAPGTLMNGDGVCYKTQPSPVMSAAGM